MKMMFAWSISAWSNIFQIPEVCSIQVASHCYDNKYRKIPKFPKQHEKSSAWEFANEGVKS